MDVNYGDISGLRWPSVIEYENIFQRNSTKVKK